MRMPSIHEHFADPRNVGEIPAPDGAGRATNPVCGDEVTVTVRLSGGRVEELRYRAFGCHATIATMSLLSERVRGMDVARACALAAGELVSWFADFPPGKTHAADVAIEALRRALQGREP